MTKQNIVNTVSEATGLTKVETEAVMNGVMSTIIESLGRNERVELRGFGTFGVKHRMPKKARNPGTGEPVYLPEIQIGGFDNVTVVNSDNSTPYLNDNLTWYAEKIFLDNYTSNNNVFGNIVFKDLAGNTVTRMTNSIIFDNSLDNLSNVSLITSNPARLDNGTHQRYFAKESDNITLSFQANEPIQILSLIHI